jgi:uncharacterized protein YbjT (DUF2867 family)
MSKHLAIIGATGGTGRSFLEQGHAAGHRVIALARDPNKLVEWRPRVELRTADGRDADSLFRALEGPIDAVVSCVGAATLREARRTTDLYSVTARNLHEAMRRRGLSRLIVVTSSGVVPQPNDGWFFRRVIKPIFLDRMYADMRAMEALVSASDLQYTIVRPPYLTKGPPKHDYRVLRGAVFDDDKSLTRADLAHFLLRCCVEPGWEREVVALSE